MATIARQRTQATILESRADSRGQSIDADIPALESNREFKFLKWRGEGKPPTKGTTVLLEVNPVRRSKYYITNGTFSDGPIDGTEASWQIDWEILAAEPLSADATIPATPDAPAALRPSESAPAPFVDANQQQHKDTAREEGINDRKAVSDILAMVEAGTYTLDGLLGDAEKLAEWYNARRRARSGSGLVAVAQEMGAVITRIAPEEHDYLIGGLVPMLKNMPELDGWVAGNGWTHAQCKTALEAAGHASRNDYLAIDGNSVQSLADLLSGALDW